MTMMWYYFIGQTKHVWQFWKLEHVWEHKSCLDSQIKNYGSVDFTLT